MKTKILSFLLILSAIAVSAQTNGSGTMPPLPPSLTIKAISAATNVAIIPFYKYDLKSHQSGYGGAALYKVSDNFWTGLRADHIAGGTTTAGVQGQLQQTFSVNDVVTVSPFIEASVGLGSSQLYGSAGPGAFIHLFQTQFKIQNRPVTFDLELIGDVEKVVNGNSPSRTEANGGLIFNLRF